MNGTPLQRKVTITNPQGLHIRPMQRLVLLAGQFASTIRLYRADRTEAFDGRSMFSLLALGATAGTELTVEVQGPDQEAALEAVVQLLTNLPQEDEPL